MECVRGASAAPCPAGPLAYLANSSKATAVKEMATATVHPPADVPKVATPPPTAAAVAVAAGCVAVAAGCMAVTPSSAAQRPEAAATAQKARALSSSPTRSTVRSAWEEDMGGGHCRLRGEEGGTIAVHVCHVGSSCPTALPPPHTYLLAHQSVIHVAALSVQPPSSPPPCTHLLAHRTMINMSALPVQQLFH